MHLLFLDFLFYITAKIKWRCLCIFPMVSPQLSKQKDMQAILYLSDQSRVARFTTKKNKKRKAPPIKFEFQMKNK